MHNTLTIDRFSLDSALRRLHTGAAEVRIPLVIDKSSRGQNLMVRPDKTPGLPGELALVVSYAGSEHSEGNRSSRDAELRIGSGLMRGRVSMSFWDPEECQRQPIHHLNMPGPGMFQIDVDPSVPQNFIVPEFVSEAISRTPAALEFPVHRRLTRLSAAIAGCGRNGVMVADLVARLGMQTIALIDPDRLSPGNIAEMTAATMSDVGKFKAEFVAKYLEETTGVRARTVREPVASPEAVSVLKESDVIFSCLDNDAGRLACAAVSGRCLKILVDVGTGIHFGTNNHDPTRRRTEAQTVGIGSHRPRRMGADIRLILPNSGVCLWCLGGLVHGETAIQDAASFRAPNLDDALWRTQRAGSLRSLNSIATGLAVRLFEDLVAERIRDSVWLRFEFDDSGKPSLRAAPTQPTFKSCPLCHGAKG